MAANSNQFNTESLVLPNSLGIAGVYDPYKNYASSLAALSPTSSRTGMHPSTMDMFANYANTNPVVERQRFLQQMFGLDISGQGGPGVFDSRNSGGIFGQLMKALMPQQQGTGNFDGARQFAQDQAGMLNQGFDQTANIARDNMRNQLLSQGGESALSSGQGQAAMANLEGQLSGQRAGNTAQMTQSIFPAALNAQGQQQQTTMQGVLGLLQALQGMM